MLLNRLVFCLLCVLSSPSVFAIGLGELNRQPVLGERLLLEVNITGAAKEVLDPSCYHLKQPSSGDEIPWVKSATLSIRKGPQPVLEIRSKQIIQEPILAIAVHLACGKEIVRDYILLPSPAQEPASVNVELSSVPQSFATEVPSASAKHSAAPRHVAERDNVTPRRSSAEPRRTPMSRISAMDRASSSDRLMLSAGDGVGEPTLGFSTELSSLNAKIGEISETQREMLRLEFRMLLALQEQAISQLEASEKLRNLDRALLDSQKNTAEQEKKEATFPVTPNPVVLPLPVATSDDSATFGEWGLYALLFLLFSGIAGWLLWKNFKERRTYPSAPGDLAQHDPEPLNEALTVVSVTDDSLINVSLESAVAADNVMHVDLNLDANEAGVTPVDIMLPSCSVGEVIESATVDERFEANPVMELADIMLSFGRVKGAAQALQEYIDANPQEALQPWMRLLDVYRMAGMRTEFEELALNLNKNFNVAIQYWEQPEKATESAYAIDFVLDEVESETKLPAKVERLEDMSRIMQEIISRWPNDDVVDFIHQLLRDNRGGARLGFALSVVEEMLFLIELKKTILRTEKEATAA